MLYFIHGNYIEVVRKLKLPFSFFRVEESEKSIAQINADLNRTPYLSFDKPLTTVRDYIGNKAKAEQNISYSQGNFYAAVFSESITKAFFVQQEDLQNHIPTNMSFGYIDDKGIACGFSVAYFPTKPNVYIITLIRNTTAPPEKREVCCWTTPEIDFRHHFGIDSTVSTNYCIQTLLTKVNQTNVAKLIEPLFKDTSLDIDYLTNLKHVTHPPLVESPPKLEKNFSWNDVEEDALFHVEDVNTLVLARLTNLEEKLNAIKKNNDTPTYMLAAIACIHRFIAEQKKAIENNPGYFCISEHLDSLDKHLATFDMTIAQINTVLSNQMQNESDKRQSTLQQHAFDELFYLNKKLTDRYKITQEELHDLKNNFNIKRYDQLYKYVNAVLWHTSLNEDYKKIDDAYLATNLGNNIKKTKEILTATFNDNSALNSFIKTEYPFENYKKYQAQVDFLAKLSELNKLNQSEIFQKNIAKINRIKPITSSAPTTEAEAQHLLFATAEKFQQRHLLQLSIQQCIEKYNALTEESLAIIPPEFTTDYNNLAKALKENALLPRLNKVKEAFLTLTPDEHVLHEKEVALFKQYQAPAEKAQLQPAFFLCKKEYETFVTQCDDITALIKSINLVRQLQQTIGELGEKTDKEYNTIITQAKTHIAESKKKIVANQSIENVIAIKNLLSGLKAITILNKIQSILSTIKEAEQHIAEDDTLFAKKGNKTAYDDFLQSYKETILENIKTSQPSEVLIPALNNKLKLIQQLLFVHQILKIKRFLQVDKQNLITDFVKKNSVAMLNGDSKEKELSVLVSKLVMTEENKLTALRKAILARKKIAPYDKELILLKNHIDLLIKEIQDNNTSLDYYLEQGRFYQLLLQSAQLQKDFDQLGKIQTLEERLASTYTVSARLKAAKTHLEESLKAERDAVGQSQQGRLSVNSNAFNNDTSTLTNIEKQIALIEKLIKLEKLLTTARYSNAAFENPIEASVAFLEQQKNALTYNTSIENIDALITLTDKHIWRITHFNQLTTLKKGLLLLGNPEKNTTIQQAHRFYEAQVIHVNNQTSFFINSKDERDALTSTIKKHTNAVFTYSIVEQLAELRRVEGTLLVYFPSSALLQKVQNLIKDATDNLAGNINYYNNEANKATFFTQYNSIKNDKEYILLQIEPLDFICTCLKQTISQESDVKTELIGTVVTELTQIKAKIRQQDFLNTVDNVKAVNKEIETQKKRLTRIVGETAYAAMMETYRTHTTQLINQKQDNLSNIAKLKKARAHRQSVKAFIKRNGPVATIGLVLLAALAASCVSLILTGVLAPFVFLGFAATTLTIAATAVACLLVSAITFFVARNNNIRSREKINTLSARINSIDTQFDENKTMTTKKCKDDIQDIFKGKNKPQVDSTDDLPVPASTAWRKAPPSGSPAQVLSQNGLHSAQPQQRQLNYSIGDSDTDTEDDQPPSKPPI